MLHRRAPSTDPGSLGVRNLLKYQYFRTTAPVRDWLPSPGFDLHTCDYDAIDGVQYHSRSYIGSPNGGSTSLARFGVVHAPNPGRQLR